MEEISGIPLSSQQLAAAGELERLVDLLVDCHGQTVTMRDLAIVILSRMQAILRGEPVPVPEYESLSKWLLADVSEEWRGILISLEQNKPHRKVRQGRKRTKASRTCWV